MFREMRRKKQALTVDESVAVLNRRTSGVLAVSGDDEYPYAVPISYVYCDSKIYFHGAQSGHKLDAIARNQKVSFCVVDQDEVIPQEYTTHYRSVIIFGKARILCNEDEKRTVLEKLTAKYSPDHYQDRLRELDQHPKPVCLVELTIEHITGKEHIELIRAKQLRDS